MPTQENNEEEIIPLTPRTEGPKIIGKLMYSESDQAWNTIRLRKEVLQRFPQLHEKRENFRYKMNIYHTYEDLLEELKEMKKGSEIVPIILMLCKKRNYLFYFFLTSSINFISFLELDISSSKVIICIWGLK